MSKLMQGFQQKLLSSAALTDKEKNQVLKNVVLQPVNISLDSIWDVKFGKNLNNLEQSKRNEIKEIWKYGMYISMGKPDDFYLHKNKFKLELKVTQLNDFLIALQKVLLLLNAVNMTKPIQYVGFFKAKKLFTNLSSVHSSDEDEEEEEDDPLVDSSSQSISSPDIR